MERYALFGVIAKEREVNERVMDYDEQNIADTGGTLLYETSDFGECKAIYEAGGFERDGKWHVVTRYIDRGKASSPQGRTHPLGTALSKEDFA